MSTTVIPTLISAVRKGTAFEERSLRILQDNLSMSLCRVGGRSDGGVDLQGWWWLPTSSPISHPAIDPFQSKRRRIRILAQCKAEKKKMSPKYVREMEGVLHRYVTGPRLPPPLPPSSLSLPPSSERPEGQDHTPTLDPIVGLLISSSPFTKSTLVHAHSSPIPFVLLHIPPRPGVDEGLILEAGEEGPPTSPNELGSIIFNSALSASSGPLTGEIEPRWERTLDSFTEGRPGLWWNGRRIPSWTPGAQ